MSTPTIQRGNPKAISLGPGILYHGSLGAVPPEDLTADWPSGWQRVGYTQEGSTFNYETSFENVEVAEELDPLDSAPTGRTATVSFASAEVTAQNLRRAMNGGTIVEGDGFDTFIPPELGQEVYAALGFQSEDGLERWVWFQCKQTGAVEMGRRKGAEKTTIANQFTVYKPFAGGPPFQVMIGAARAGA